MPGAPCGGRRLDGPPARRQEAPLVAARGPCSAGKGHSGCSGEGIAASRHIGFAATPDTNTFDLSPAASPVKLAAAWVDGVFRGGVLILSVYLWHIEGAAERNLEILSAAGEAAARDGGPWIIAGDFQYDAKRAAR